MEERLSILEEEKFAECRLCNHLVSSLNPICKNCGLEMSREGIIELAELKDYREEINQTISIEFADIHNLRNISFLSLALTIIGYFFSLALGFYVFFKLYFWMGLFIYFSIYTSWNRKFAKETLSVEDIELVNKEKTISLLIFFSSTILGAIIYIFLLK